MAFDETKIRWRKYRTEGHGPHGAGTVYEGIYEGARHSAFIGDNESTEQLRNYHKEMLVDALRRSAESCPKTT